MSNRHDIYRPGFDRRTGTVGEDELDWVKTHVLIEKLEKHLDALCAMLKQHIAEIDEAGDLMFEGCAECRSEALAALREVGVACSAIET
jgi:hypothetical protein